MIGDNQPNNQTEYEKILSNVVPILRQASNEGKVEIERDGDTSSELSKRLFDREQRGLILITPELHGNTKFGLTTLCNMERVPLMTVKSSTDNNEIGNQKFLYSLLHPELTKEQIERGHNGVKPQDYPKLVAIKEWDENSREVSGFMELYMRYQEQQPANE